MKRNVTENNKSFKMTDVERLFHDHIDVSMWKNCIRHVEELQEEDFAN